MGDPAENVRLLAQVTRTYYPQDMDPDIVAFFVCDARFGMATSGHCIEVLVTVSAMLFSWVMC